MSALSSSRINNWRRRCKWTRFKNYLQLNSLQSQENDLTIKNLTPASLFIYSKSTNNCIYVYIYLNRRISSGISYVARSPKVIDKQQGKEMDRKSSWIHPSRMIVDEDIRRIFRKVTSRPRLHAVHLQNENKNV